MCSVRFNVSHSHAFPSTKEKPKGKDKRKTSSTVCTEPNSLLCLAAGFYLLSSSDHSIRCKQWDTGGSETYRSVVSHYLRGADGIVLCFDVTRKVRGVRVRRCLRRQNSFSRCEHGVAPLPRDGSPKMSTAVLR